MSVMLPSLKDMSQKGLEDWVQGQGFPAYRGRQIFLWLWHRGVSDADEMLNLPRSLREIIKNETELHLSTVPDSVGEPLTDTRKFLFRMRDGHFAEAVLIVSAERRTVCVSSQVGCALGCRFCQTGRMGQIRDLSAGEILEQLDFFRRHSDKALTNVVFMGMGEPFLNFSSVMQAAVVMNHEAGFNIGARKITLSTAGIVPSIRQFADLHTQFKLAISLGSPFQEERKVLMPISRKYPLSELMESVEYYIKEVSKRVTFEYVLLDDVNMSPKHVEALIRLLSPLNCKLNLIPFNETDTEYRRPSDEKIFKFEAALQKRATFPVTLRWSGGRDKNAACGQLYYKHTELG